MLLVTPILCAKSKCKVDHSCCESETTRSGKKSLRHSKKRKSKLDTQETLRQLSQSVDVGEVYESRMDAIVLPAITDTELYPHESYGSAAEQLAESEEVYREEPRAPSFDVTPMPVVSGIAREFEPPIQPIQPMQAGEIGEPGQYRYEHRRIRQQYAPPGRNETK